MKRLAYFILGGVPAPVEMFHMFLYRIKIRPFLRILIPVFFHKFDQLCFLAFISFGQIWTKRDVPSLNKQIDHFWKKYQSIVVNPSWYSNRSSGLDYKINLC